MATAVKHFRRPNDPPAVLIGDAESLLAWTKPYLSVMYLYKRSWY